MKSKKKKKQSKENYESTAKKQLKSALKRFNFKRLLNAFVTFIVVFLIYQVGIFFQFKPIIHIYSWLTFFLAMAFFILNRGFGKLSSKVNEENLPKDLSDEQKKAYLHAEKIRTKYKLIALYLLTAFLLTLFIDSIYLVYFQWFAQ